MTRRGISYTMTIAVVGVILLISATLLLTAFSGQLDQVTRLLGMQQEQSAVDLCADRVQSFCAQDINEGADWANRYPDCEQYANQIDAGGDTSCPLTE